MDAWESEERESREGNDQVREIKAEEAGRQADVMVLFCCCTFKASPPKLNNLTVSATRLQFNQA